MRFSSTAFVSILSLSFLSGAIAAPAGDSTSLEAREAYPNHENISQLEARKKKPKVNVKLSKGKLSGKDQQDAKYDAEDCLEKYGYKEGDIVYAYHLSNGETVEHITVNPKPSGKMIHAYRDGICTQGTERRPHKRDEVDEEDEHSLVARAKNPKVTVKLQKGKLNSKDYQTAIDDATDALIKYKKAAGTIVYAYHLSNGESVEHITVEPSDGSKKIHAYRDGVFTQGDERRP